MDKRAAGEGLTDGINRETTAEIRAPLNITRYHLFVVHTEIPAVGLVDNIKNWEGKGR